MKLEEIKQKSNLKVLLRGKSGYGKTYNSVRASLEVSGDGNDVLYVDTETEAATTIVTLVERGEFDEEDLEGITYVQVSDYDELVAQIDPENHRDYDLMVVDTLDHKHTFCSRKVMEDVLDEEEQGDGMDPDWNVYPEIYARERAIMETLQKCNTNLLATLDPDSGSMDKNKGCQTNVHGYFTAVLDLKKDDAEYAGIIRNWVASEGAVNDKVTEVDEVLAQKFIERTV